MTKWQGQPAIGVVLGKLAEEPAEVCPGSSQVAVTREERSQEEQHETDDDVYGWTSKRHGELGGPPLGFEGLIVLRLGVFELVLLQRTV